MEFTLVDVTKTRRRIEEALRKDTADTSIVELAEKLGIEAAYIPQQPEDYHDELGRPNFGPKQVRHASDLKIGQMYWLIHFDKRGRMDNGRKVRLIKLYCEPTTTYLGDREEEAIEWYMEYIVVGNSSTNGNGMSGAIRLACVNIHPYKDSFPRHNNWNAQAYLVFTEEQLCSCNLPHSGTQQK